MKKLVVLILAVLPLISGAQVISVVGKALLLSFNESSAYKSFIVPPKTSLYINYIHSDADLVKLKISVGVRVDANQSPFAQSLTFKRSNLTSEFPRSIFLPEESKIEFDGVPVILFCWLTKD